MTATIIEPFHGDHDHDACLQSALRNAENSCREQGLRLTQIRRQVLALIWKSHKPQTAYDVLEGLGSFGHRPAPPTAYRALQFLEQAGLIHRIESLNAYIGCADPERHHSGQFLICEKCDAVAEIQDSSISVKVSENAQALGFQAHYQTIEVRGLCKDCASD